VNELLDIHLPTQPGPRRDFLSKAGVRELPEITGIGFRIHQVSGWLFRPLKQAILKDTGWGNLEETVSVKNRLSLGKSYPPLTKLRRGEDR
jgi:hypothetical protein